MAQIFDFQGFYAYYYDYSAYAEMYRKNQKFRVGSGWVGLGGGQGGFSAYAEMRNGTSQVLDFQGFASFRKFSATFPHPFRKCATLLKMCDNKTKQRINSLSLNTSQTLLKRLIFNAFKHA
jgi:hypothetical protein